MKLRALFVSVAALAVLPVTAVLAEISEPVPIGAGGILIQYETTKPTDAQIRICEKLGGEISQLANGKYVCVRRST